jgi:hypothetical protein
MVLLLIASILYLIYNGFKTYHAFRAWKESQINLTKEIAQQYQL